MIISPTERVYVGQSRNISKRKSVYRTLKCQKQVKLFTSLKKYGWDAHHFEVIMPLKDGIDQGMMDMWEQFFIDNYRDNGYRLLNIREGGFRGPHSADSLHKLSASLKGKKRGPYTKEHARNISIAKKGKSNGLEGRQLNEYQKTNLIRVNKTRVRGHSERLKHAIAVSGEKSGKAKLTELQVRIIYRLLQFGERISHICKCFNVQWQTIDSIRRGKSWSQVTGIYHPKRKFILS